MKISDFDWQLQRLNKLVEIAEQESDERERRAIEVVIGLKFERLYELTAFHGFKLEKDGYRYIIKEE